MAASFYVPAVTFNAPGAKEYATIHKLVFPQRLRIRNFIRDNDVVGTFGQHLGLMQHIGNFYVEKEERQKLDNLFEEQENVHRPLRAQRLVQELAAYPERMQTYATLLREYEEGPLAQYNKSLETSYSITKGLYHAFKRPVAPIKPVKPTEEQMKLDIPNPLSAQHDHKEIAQKTYEIPAYILMNHGLKSIIWQLRDEQESD